MENYTGRLQALYDRVPRRHSAENIAEINLVIDAYTDLLGEIESVNAWYEKNTAGFYPSLDTIQQTIKSSNSNKHSKKAKDQLFDDASGTLKDDIQSLIQVCNNPNSKD